MTSVEGQIGQSAVALGIVNALKASGKSVGVMRPIVANTDDTFGTHLANAAGATLVGGTTYDAYHADPEEALAQVVAARSAAGDEADVLVALGSDFSDVSSLGELAFNAQAAANLNAPLVLVVPAKGRTPEQVRLAADLAVRETRAQHAVVAAVVATEAADADATVQALQGAAGYVAASTDQGESLDAKALATAVLATDSQVRTPLAFVDELTRLARASKKTIVLPESSDDRILQSAAICLERGTANIILLGEKDAIEARCKELGISVEGAQIISPNDPELVEKFAQEYAVLRAKKGVTLEQARETLKDLSYFGTMMIHFGMADGMVSGAVNTTANTIKPSFEFIKTKPGAKVVSSSFLMCMPDRVLVMGDSAVNPNPTPEQLADIAIGCAETAARFGIDPRVAMLSYSTAGSGKGPDVDAVIEATKIAQELRPDLKIEGPIQFDAAMDPTVGKKKMPGSEVAGQATVYIFPDLNTGNNTYKAIQRTSGALAIGPILQGLNKPVNDLSRGALVDDIVNTVAITAIQAQDEGK